MFYKEAAAHDVFPLDNSTLARWNAPRPNLTGGRTEFAYVGGLTGVPNSGAPNILNKSYTITAEVTIPSGGAEGMIVTDGGRFGGYGLFLRRSYRWWLESPLVRNVGLGLLVVGLLLLLSATGSRGRRRFGSLVLGLGTLWLVAVLATRMFGLGSGKPVFLYNLLDLERTIWTGPSLGAGKHTIVFDWKSTEPGLGKGGTGVLSVDGKEVARNYHGKQHAGHLPGGRELRRRRGHPERGGAGAVSLRSAVQVHRHDRQADDQARPRSRRRRRDMQGPGASPRPRRPPPAWWRCSGPVSWRDCCSARTCPGSGRSSSAASESRWWRSASPPGPAGARARQRCRRPERWWSTTC